MPTAAPSAPKSKKTRNTGTLVIERTPNTGPQDWRPVLSDGFSDKQGAEVWIEGNGETGFFYRIIRVLGEFKVTITSRQKLALL